MNDNKCPEGYKQVECRSPHDIQGMDLLATGQEAIAYERKFLEGYLAAGGPIYRKNPDAGPRRFTCRIHEFDRDRSSGQFDQTTNDKDMVGARYHVIEDRPGETVIVVKDGYGVMLKHCDDCAKAIHEAWRLAGRPEEFTIYVVPKPEEA